MNSFRPYSPMRAPRASLPLLAILGLCLASTLACARGSAQVLTRTTESLEFEKTSLALLAFRSRNDFKPAAQPLVKQLIIRSLAGDRKLHRLKVKDPSTTAADGGFEYLLTFALPPGRYELEKATGISSGFWTGQFEVPIHSEFEMQAGQIVYLGRIDVVNRERKSEDEKRSGGVTAPGLTIYSPVFQSVTGFLGGTFDVSITDDFDRDREAFEKAFPLLQSRGVERSILTRRQPAGASHGG